MTQDAPGPLELADEALAIHAKAIDLAANRLALAVGEPGGRIENDRLDEHQIEAFRFAHLYAQGHAGQALVEWAGQTGSSQAAATAHLFACEALGDLRAELCSRPGSWRVSAVELSKGPDSPRARALVGDGLRSEVWAAHWLQVEESGELPSGLDPEQDMIRREFRRFADQEVTPRAEAVHRHDQLVPAEIIRGVADLGCFGLSVPERYGGLQPDDGADNLGMVLVTEELSRGSLGAAGSLITRPEILSKALMAGGTEAQREYWLPRLASGESMCAVAVTEPDYGSDVAGLKLQATPTEGGWLLNGQKTWCTFAGYADVLMVLARTEPDPNLAHRGLSILLATKPRFEGHDFETLQQGRSGKLAGRAIDTIGYRGMHSYDLFFDDWFVPADGLLGGEGGRGRGFYYQMSGFAGGRLQTAARATGLMQAAYERACSYAKERRVFGRPIAEYGLTAWKLARMAMIVQAARQFTWRAARRMEVDERAGALDASLVKLWACRQAEWVTREAMQIHGGMGYAEEYDVSRYFADARVLSIFEGAEEVLALRVIARQVLQARLDAGGPQ